MDQQRLVNLPRSATSMVGDGPREIRMWATTHPMITNVRYAEGCKPAQDMLAQGKS